MTGSGLSFIFPDGVLNYLGKAHPKKWKKKKGGNVWEINLTPKRVKRRDWATLKDAGSTAELHYNIADSSWWQEYSNNAPEIMQIREILKKIEKYHDKK